MDITLEKKDKVNAFIKINLKEADYKEKYTSKLKEYGKKAQLKGFRPGHVPPSLIEKMYGKSILVDEINSLLSTSIMDYIKTNQIDILGEPMPQKEDAERIDWDNQKDFNFTYNLGLTPEFQMEISDKIVFDNYKINYGDKIVKETIENLRKQFGTYSDVDTISIDDILYADAKDLATGKVYKSITPMNRVSEASLKVLKTKKVGDKYVEDLNVVYPESASIAYALGIDKKEAETLSGSFEFTIERISSPQGAELDETFFKKVFRTENITDYATFEAKLKENIAQNYQMEGKNALANDIFDYYTKNTKIEFPTEFLKDWLYVANEGKLTKDQIEEQYPSFETSLRWDLIKNKVAKDFEIKVEHNEVMDRARAMVQSQFGLQGQLEEEMQKIVDQWADNLLKRDNGKEYRKMFEEIYSDKVIETISGKVKLKDISIDIEEFKKKREAKK
ncbi:MAG: trigger factor [Bacteroidota bacterium]|nr:trigger factor [Bacteroidota bacterium]